MPREYRCRPRSAEGARTNHAVRHNACSRVLGLCSRHLAAGRSRGCVPRTRGFITRKINERLPQGFDRRSPYRFYAVGERVFFRYPTRFCAKRQGRAPRYHTRYTGYTGYVPGIPGMYPVSIPDTQRLTRNTACWNSHTCAYERLPICDHHPS